MTDMIKYDKQTEILYDMFRQVDTTGWDEQNKKDYQHWLKVEAFDKTKKITFDYFEIDNGKRKEYDVNYKHILGAGYVPYIRKYVTNKDGKQEKKLIQVGRALSPFEYDRYVLICCERSAKEAMGNI